MNHSYNPSRQYRKKKRATIYRRIIFLLSVCMCITILIIGMKMLQNKGLLRSNSVFQKENEELILSLDEEADIRNDESIDSKDNEVADYTHDNSITEKTSHSSKKGAGSKTNESDLPSSDIEENTDETAWCLTLVNKWNELPSNYNVELTELSNGECVDTRIYPMLQRMFDAARADGIYPIVASGYRTAQKQQDILDGKIEELKSSGYSNEDAEAEAKYWVAVPGTSEHQLGLAVDINADGVHSYGNDVYKWLEKNAHLYGFINRYPADKKELTGVANEPWHYRYVGVEAATKINKRGICLEEYLDEYSDN